MVDAVWTPYCGPAPDPIEALSRWNGDPILWVVLTAATVAGLVLLRGPERGRYTAAMTVLVIGFISPLCALSSALFTARTLHHLLLVLAAAPLLALCVPAMR